MDLLDGSDVDEGDVDLDEENALLGSDDEEYSKCGVGAEYEYDCDEEHVLHTEDSDVLELELNDEDGLEFEEESYAGGRRKCAPVQVRPSAIPARQQNRGNSSSVQHSAHQEEIYTPEVGPVSKTEVDGEDDEDEDDDRNTRSRFQNERNTLQTNPSTASASGSPFGSPIQTLGGRKVQTVDFQRQKQWGNGRPHLHPQGQRQFLRPQRFPHNRHTLLGEGPRAGFNPFIHRPQINGGANVQFQERIFTDFNQPIRSQNHQQLAVVQGQRTSNGPRHQGNINGGPRPGSNMGGPRGPPRQLNPSFPPQGNNNRQMRPRNHNPGHLNQRPPHQWRNQGPQRHPFPGMPNQPMQNIPPMQPPPPFHHEQRPQRPPLFGHNMRHEMHPQVPYNNLPGPNVQPVPPVAFGPGPLIGQPFRMPMGPPEMMPPVQPVQPFFHAHQQQQQPYMQEPHNPQGFWPPQINENNGWGGPPPPAPPAPQNFAGHVPIPQTNQGYQMPIESVMPNQSSQFLESQTTQQRRPGPAYEQLHHRPPYFEQQRQQQYQYEQESHGNNFQHENRSQVRVPEIPIRNEGYEERSEYQYPRQERLPQSKRKCETEDRYYRESPEKRLNGRLGPPVRHEQPIKDEKAEELLKIREETRKTMGLDDEYIKKLEEQKRLREQILRKKAEARRKINTLGDTEEEIRSKKLGHELLKTETVNCAGRPSIYINPKAFRGDLSALNCNLKKINVGSGEAGKQGAVVSVPSSSKVFQAVKNDGSTDNLQFKPRTILRIVKDKHGNVISRSKVIVRLKQQPSASTKAS